LGLFSAALLFVFAIVYAITCYLQIPNEAKVYPQVLTSYAHQPNSEPVKRTQARPELNEGGTNESTPYALQQLTKIQHQAKSPERTLQEPASPNVQDMKRRLRPTKSTNNTTELIKSPHSVENRVRIYKVFSENWTNLHKTKS